MPPKVNDSHVALRRRRVASYMIRGVSQQEIVEALPQESFWGYASLLVTRDFPPPRALLVWISPTGPITAIFWPSGE
jgi:hypothetical protein